MGEPYYFLYMLLFTKLRFSADIGEYCAVVGDWRVVSHGQVISKLKVYIERMVIMHFVTVVFVLYTYFTVCGSFFGPVLVTAVRHLVWFC
jgi:hypothetical protein